MSSFVRPATSRSGMQIFVQLPFGKRSSGWLGIKPRFDELSHLIKSVIEGRLGIPVDQQRFALEVPNDRKVSDLANVTNDIDFILLPIYQEPPPRKGKREMEEEEAPDKLN